MMAKLKCERSYGENSVIGRRLQNSGFNVFESSQKGELRVSKSNTIVTLIIADTLEKSVPETYKQWKQAGVKDFNAWEASRWLRKY